MGLKGSGAAERNLLPGDIIRLVAKETANNQSGLVGHKTMKKQIALRTGIHLKQ
jgi:hypothetical protein